MILGCMVFLRLRLAGCFFRMGMLLLGFFRFMVFLRLAMLRGWLEGHCLVI
jgi:hypothetical protein